MPVQSSTPAHNTFGVNVLSIRGPYYGFVRRSDPKWGGFDKADRVYRMKWLKDQVFSANDGKQDITRNPDYYKARVNVIRRIIRTPMDMFEEGLRGVVSAPKAILIRGTTSMVFRTMVISWFMAYNIMYVSNDWTRVGGFEMRKARPAIYPGDENWPNVPDKKPHEYEHNGFYNSAFAQL